MAREKFKTLTEQMFYILISLNDECCGVDIMKRVLEITDNEIKLGPGTLYSLLDNFLKDGFIEITSIENRRKNYKITSLGKEMVEKEYKRLKKQVEHFEKLVKRKV